MPKLPAYDERIVVVAAQKFLYLYTNQHASSVILLLPRSTEKEMNSAARTIVCEKDKLPNLNAKFEMYPRMAAGTKAMICQVQMKSGYGQPRDDLLEKNSMITSDAYAVNKLKVNNASVVMPIFRVVS